MNTATTQFSPSLPRYSKADLQRRANVFSWVCQLLNIAVWIVGVRAVYATALVPTWALFLLVSVAILGQFGVLGGYRPIPHYLDRVAWNLAIIVPIASGNWVTSVFALFLAFAWYMASAVGTNAYIRANRESEPEAA